MTSRFISTTAVRRAVTTCVHRTLADLLGVDEWVLEPDLSLADDLAVDSMELLEVALALEDTFDVAVPQGRLDGRAHLRPARRPGAAAPDARDGTRDDPGRAAGVRHGPKPLVRLLLRSMMGNQIVWWRRDVPANP